MVGHHHLEEQPIELGARGRFELSHLSITHHPGVGGVVHLPSGLDVLAPFGQPAGHLLDLGALGGLDAARQIFDAVAPGSGGGELGHLNGLLVVRDHHLSELDIGAVVFGHLRDRGLIAGLDDGWIIVRRARCADDDHDRQGWHDGTGAHGGAPSVGCFTVAML
jgi:hypothetical protein